MAEAVPYRKRTRDAEERRKPEFRHDRTNQPEVLADREPAASDSEFGNGAFAWLKTFAPDVHVRRVPGRFWEGARF